MPELLGDAEGGRGEYPSRITIVVEFGKFAGYFQRGAVQGKAALVGFKPAHTIA